MPKKKAINTKLSSIKSETDSIYTIDDVLEKLKQAKALAGGCLKKIPGIKFREVRGGWREIEIYYSFYPNGRAVPMPMNVPARTVGTIQDEYQKNLFVLAKQIYSAFECLEYPWQDSPKRANIDRIFAKYDFIGSEEPKQKGKIIILQSFIQNLRDFIQAYNSFKEAYTQLSENPEVFNISFHEFLKSLANDLALHSSLEIKDMKRVVESILEEDKLKQTVDLSIDDVLEMQHDFHNVYEFFEGMIGPFKSVDKDKLEAMLKKYLSKELILNFQYYLVEARINNTSSLRLLKAADSGNRAQIKGLLLNYADPRKEDDQKRTAKDLWRINNKFDAKTNNLFECAEWIYSGKDYFQYLISSVNQINMMLQDGTGNVVKLNRLAKQANQFMRDIEFSFKEACLLDINFVGDYIAVMIDNATKQLQPNSSNHQDHRYILALITVSLDILNERIKDNEPETSKQPRELIDKIEKKLQELAIYDVHAQTVLRLFKDQDAKTEFLVRHGVLAKLLNKPHSQIPWNAGQTMPSLFNLSFIRTVNADYVDKYHLLRLALSCSSELDQLSIRDKGKDLVDPKPALT